VRAELLEPGRPPNPPDGRLKRFFGVFGASVEASDASVDDATAFDWNWKRLRPAVSPPRPPFGALVVVVVVGASVVVANEESH